MRARVSQVQRERYMVMLEGREIPARLKGSFSAYTGEGMEKIARYLEHGETIALLGSSGVGKSTFVNTIAGQEIMKTNEVRQEDARGRHTTTHRQMILLENGVTLIDTPGMREFGVCDVSDGLEETFQDIRDMTKQCRFHNCSHTKEPGCAIREALEKGNLSKKRWEMFRRLTDENTWAAKLTRNGKFKT